MSVILNQTKYAINALEKHDLGDKPSETIGMIVKYLKLQTTVDDKTKKERLYNNREIRDRLKDYLKLSDPNYNDVKWVDLINNCIKYSKKYPLKDIDAIYITANELNTIKEIGRKSLEKLAFTLLCLAKYTNARSGKNSNWVNFDDKEIFKMANIQEDIETQQLLYYDLRNIGLLKYSKDVESLSVNVLYVDNTDEIKLEITDFKNLGYQYLLWKGEKFIKCEACGELIRQNGNKQKY
jgi:hypothetical protein